MKEAGIDWHGFYPCRRGMSSITTEESKDALTATGLLRHASPITTLKHYTRAQEEAIINAMRQVETKALAMMKEPKLIEAGNGG
jgi:hypothetical protein